MHILQTLLVFYLLDHTKQIPTDPSNDCHSTDHHRKHCSLLSQLHLTLLEHRWLTCWEFQLKVSCFFLHYFPISTIKHFCWHILRWQCVFLNLNLSDGWWSCWDQNSAPSSFWAIWKWRVSAYRRVFLLVTIIRFPSCHTYFCTPQNSMLTVLVCSAWYLSVSPANSIMVPSFFISVFTVKLYTYYLSPVIVLLQPATSSSTKTCCHLLHSFMLAF